MLRPNSSGPKHLAGGAARFAKPFVPGANIYLSGAVPAGVAASVYGAHLLTQAAEGTYGRPAAAAPPAVSSPCRERSRRIPVANVAQAKQALRLEMRAARAARGGDGAAAALAVRDRFLALFGDARPSSAASGYWPIGDELDPRPLLEALCARGWTCALPVVRGRGKPLYFRCWQPGDRLIASGLRLCEPGPDAPESVPAMVVAPMLAADPAGRRLGYGGGYYDRTIHALRATAAVTVVAIGYDVQIRPGVPADTGDQRVDWVLSETRAVRCAAPLQEE